MGLSTAPPPPNRKGKPAQKPRPYFVGPIKNKVAGMVSLCSLLLASKLVVVWMSIALRFPLLSCSDPSSGFLNHKQEAQTFPT